MENNSLILGLVLNTIDCINFLKKHKDYHVSRRLHGAKKNLIRLLNDHFKMVECQRVLQFNPKITQQQKSCSECGIAKQPSGHCMIKFTFCIMDHYLTFHLPKEEADYALDYKLTTKNVRLLIGKIPSEKPSSYKSSEQIEEVIKLLNNLPSLKLTEINSNNQYSSPRDRYLYRLERYLTDHSPLKLSSSPI